MIDKKDLPTIWEVSDDLWGRIEPILEKAWPRRRGPGRPHIDWRKCINGIIYHMRTGCQWNALPKEFGDDSSVHRWFQRWCELGVMEQIWADLVAECEELKQVHWDWQSADGCMGKARHGGDKVGKNPTDRGKNGTKRSVIVDEQGGPLGVVIDGANRHDAKLLEATIEAIVVDRPDPIQHPQHLCLDKGYQGAPVRRIVQRRGYVLHVPKSDSDPTVRRQGRRSRRWVVERAHSWTNRARRLLVRWEKKAVNYLGFVHLQFAYTALKVAGLLG